MATQTVNPIKEQSARLKKDAEQAKDITHDMVEYVTEYARQNPGHAALWCLGVGFVLGWRLKPW